MPAFNDGFLDLPQRPGKPRMEGLTHVIDKGLNLRDIEGMFDTGGQFVDIVKLGWGTSYVTNNLEKKIALYRSFETPVVCGGTLFEAVYGRDKMDEFKAWLKEFRFSHVEISDGTLEIPRERKLELIREEQALGRLVAMTGDGTNDAPALAQADVAVAMHSGTQAAKEAGNMVDLDSNPTKLIEIVEIGKQLLMTRGALTTFSIASSGSVK